MSDLAQIGVAGLAVMGRNLARNLARHGHRVAVHNRTYARTEGFMAEYGNEDEFVLGKSMGGPRQVAGAATADSDHGQGWGAHQSGDRRTSAAAGDGRQHLGDVRRRVRGRP
jgi:hypothetical protein